MLTMRVVVGAECVTLETAVRRAVRHVRKGMGEAIARAPDDLGVRQDQQRWGEEAIRGILAVVARETFIVIK